MLALDLVVIALTLDVIGKVMLGFTVLFVHRRLMKEHRVDREVLKEMKQEQILGALAIVFIVAGYVLHLMAI